MLWSVYRKLLNRRKQELLEIDSDLNSMRKTMEELNRKKTDLLLSIEQEKQKLEELTKKTKKLSDLERMEEVIAEKGETLRHLEANIDLKLDIAIQKLRRDYPNLKIKAFSIPLPSGYYSYYIKKSYFKSTLDSILIDFALKHNLDPNLYIEIMYRYNASWLETYENAPASLTVNGSDNKEYYYILKDSFILFEEDLLGDIISS